MVFQEGRDIVLGEGAHLLQGGAEDGKAVVAAHPEVTLAVLEKAVELCGGRLIDGRVFRLCCIDRPQAVGTGRPELAMTVCQEPRMGNGKSAQGNRFTVLEGIQEGGMVFEGVEFSAGFRVASDAVHSFPGG